MKIARVSLGIYIMVLVHTRPFIKKKKKMGHYKVKNIPMTLPFKFSCNPISWEIHKHRNFWRKDEESKRAENVRGTLIVFTYTMRSV